MTSMEGGPKPTSRLYVRRDPAHEHGVYAMWIGAGGNYILEWGDGTSTPMTAVRPPVRHVYPAAGDYVLRGVRQDEHHDITRPITIPFAPPPPPWSPEVRGGTLSLGVRIPPGGPSGTWRVYWPDWDAENVTPAEGEWIDRPALPGRHTLHVVHTASGDGYDCAPATVTDVAREVTADITVDGRTVRVRRTAPHEEGRGWHVVWGDEWSFDGGVARRATPLVDDRAEHTYVEPGTYVLEIASSYLGRVYVGSWEVTV